MKFIFFADSLYRRSSLRLEHSEMEKSLKELLKLKDLSATVERTKSLEKYKRLDCKKAMSLGILAFTNEDNLFKPYKI